MMRLNYKTNDQEIKGNYDYKTESGDSTIHCAHRVALWKTLRERGMAGDNASIQR